MSSLPPPPPPTPPGPPAPPPGFGGAPMTDQTRSRAGFGSRLLAMIVDGVVYGLPAIAGLVTGVVMMVVSFKDCIDKAQNAGSEVTCTDTEVNKSLLLAGILVIAGSVLLWLIMIIVYNRSLGRTGQTVGRRMARIRVVDQYTLQPIGFGRAFGRSCFAYFISSAIVYLGYLWMLWDSEKQTWHDKVVGSIVIDA